MNKKQAYSSLYESIIKNVAKEVKRALNESDLDREMARDRAYELAQEQAEEMAWEREHMFDNMCFFAFYFPEHDVLSTDEDLFYGTDDPEEWAFEIKVFPNNPSVYEDEFDYDGLDWDFSQPASEKAFDKCVKEHPELTQDHITDLLNTKEFYDYFKGIC